MCSDKKSRERFIYVAVFIAVFVFLLVFFSRIHPILLLDGDDWTYISFPREALPSPGDWNPARVLPEMLMPAVGAVAAHLVAPLLGDYLNAITATYAFVISTAIVGYLLCFSRWLAKDRKLGLAQNLLLTLLFLAVHFWMFRKEYEGNIYLFQARNLTCYFFYTIPTLLCASLVLIFETDQKIWDHASVTGKGVLLLLSYLAVFSNMFSSIVIVAYSGVVLLQQLFSKAGSKPTIKTLWGILLENGFFLCIILMWLVSLGFELTGGRAVAVGIDSPASGFTQVFTGFIRVLGSMSKYFCLMVFVGCSYATVLLIRNLRKKDKNENVMFLGSRSFRFIGAGIVTLVYQFLLCGVTGLTHYIESADVLISIFFFALVELFIIVLFALAENPKLGVLIPLVLCVAVSLCDTWGDTYKESNMYEDSSAITASITRDIYNQIMDAQDQGLTAVDIKVPVFDGDENWPVAYYMGGVIPKTLYEHGQLATLIEVTIVPDIERNELLGMPIP